MRISDWSSDVCSSDLACRPTMGPQSGTGRPGRSGARSRSDWLLRGEHQFDMMWVFPFGTWLLVPIRERSRAPPGGGTRDRKSVVEVKSVAVRVDRGGRRIIQETQRR